jgi:hypothetical protein
MEQVSPVFSQNEKAAVTSNFAARPGLVLSTRRACFSGGAGLLFSFLNEGAVHTALGVAAFPSGAVVSEWNSHCGAQKREPNHEGHELFHRFIFSLGSNRDGILTYKSHKSSLHVRVGTLPWFSLTRRFRRIF